MEDGSYTRWVKKLKCCACGEPADDPHHPHGVFPKGMATKVPDYWVIPMCRRCHDELHHDFAAWEERHGPQLQFALMTLTQAIYEGVLK